MYNEYMVVFADQEEQKRIEFLRRREEEELAQVLSQKYGVEYVDLTLVAVNVGALSNPGVETGIGRLSRPLPSPLSALPSSTTS